MVVLALREYTSRVRSKWFLIGTILTPLTVLTMVYLPHLLKVPSASKQTEILVIDMTGRIYPDFAQTLRSAGLTVARLPLTGTTYESARQELRDKMTTGVIDACLLIPDDIHTNGRAEYYVRNLINPSVVAKVESALNSAVLKGRLVLRRLKDSEVAALLQPIRLVTRRLQGAQRPKGNFLWVMIFTMILFGSILLHGTSVLRSTLKEKLSRTVELILSSVTPFQLMSSKIVGAAAVGLTQYLTWFIFGILAFLSSESLGGSKLIPLSPQVLLCFLALFVLGYLFFSSLFAAAGAICSSENEAQQVMSPLFVLLLGSVFMAPWVMQNLDSRAAVALSMIPFFSPVVMFVRVALGSPPVYETCSSMAILAISTGLTILVAAKTFRIGILMYGKRLTLNELGALLRHP